MTIPTRLYDFSATASSNVPAGSESIGTSLDDYLRAIQAIIRGDLATKGADIASGSTADLGAVAGLFHDITGTTTITSFGTVAAGIWKVVKFEGALTLTHNATSLILPGGANITTANGDIAIVISEGAGNWRVITYQKASGVATVETAPVPTGAVMPFAGATAPTGWLLCYGQAVSQATYAALYAILGTTYGSDAGGNFTLPDLRGRVPAGQDDMGGSSANRLTGVTGGVDGDVLGGTGGEEAHALTIAELAAHTHLSASTGANILTSAVGNLAGGGGIGGDTGVTVTGSTGSGTAHNVVQPTIILNYVIKF